MFGDKRFGEVFVTKYRFKEKTMQQGYVIPLSEVSRNVLNKMIPVTYIEKPKQIVPCTGKLSTHDVDVIRFLLFMGVKAHHIGGIFNVNKSAPFAIKTNQNHYNHKSVFQNNNYNVLDFDRMKIQTWYKENREYVLNLVESANLDLVAKIEIKQIIN